MTIPFLDIFKRASAHFLAKSDPVAAAAPSRPTVVEKSTSERLSKTVMPNVVRSLAPDPFRSPTEAVKESGQVSVHSPQKLPPSVALALQPKVERAISLQLSDLLGQLPAGYIKPAESFDAGQRILLKASEIEKGMATGKPSVSLATIYEQVPEIFLRNVPPGDASLVPLPFEKVLAEFRNAHVRDDQEKDHDVPQLDTPILQVTREDTQRFGTTMPVLQTSAHPPVKVEPATARALSSAEPEPAGRETMAAPMTPKGVPLNLSTSPPAAAPSSNPDPVSPTRIPFKLPPNGTGGAASENVPASSGPPVPTSAPKSAGPSRIAFKMSAPCADLKPKLTLVPGVAKAEQKTPPADAFAQTRESLPVSLGLRVILQSMPAFQLKGSAEAVPADARISFPFSCIEGQLASGRVAIPMKAFREALPENHRELVPADEADSPVLLPLQEVLKNLPSAALKMRDDQEETRPAEVFETPFSMKAAEDAKRFGIRPVSEPVGQVATPLVESKAEQSPVENAPNPLPEKAESAILEKPVEKAPEAASPTVTGNTKDRAEEKADLNKGAKGVVARASSLPGVAGSAISFEDGLSLAGNLPEDIQAGGLCAMAPSVLNKINRHTADTKLGPLRSMTLHWHESRMSFFMKGSVCLSVLHAGGDLDAHAQDQLAEMANELSRTYSQPEAVHVDH